jgi:hypothetical protein
VFGKNLARYAQAIARAWLDTHFEGIRDEVAAEKESQAFIFELQQHLADTSALESEFFRARSFEAQRKEEQRHGEAALAPEVLGALWHKSMIAGRGSIPAAQQNRAVLRQ